MKKKVLVTVLTYPCPSHKYTETVCTAGVTENGEWIRLYPIPLRLFDIDIHKYGWYEFDVEHRLMKDDPRRESYHCVGGYPRKDEGILGTEDSWRERRKYCIENVRVFHTIREWESAIDIDKPGFLSLGTFKPEELLDLKARKKNTQKEDAVKQTILAKREAQGTLFDDEDRNKYWKMAKSMPYAFYYTFRDGNGETLSLMIEDWEMYVLFLHCRKRCDSDREAIAKIRAKYIDEFRKKDIYFFLGTRMIHQMKKYPTPYSIIGVFYPPKEEQLALFT